MRKAFIMLALIMLVLTGCVAPKYQHVPSLMEGDCVDRAVAIRQDLRAKGYEAELVIGTLLINGKKEGGHMWIKYRDKKTGEWINIYNY